VRLTLRPRAETGNNGFTRTAATNADGDFVVRGLAPGDYLISNGNGDSGLFITVADQQNPPLRLILRPDNTLSLKTP